MTGIPFFAVTTRGLEEVSAQEIGELIDVTIEQVAYRRILGRCDGALDGLTRLLTVDDLFLLLAQSGDLSRHRNALGTLRDLGATLDIAQVAAWCASVRAVRRSPTFSVTASFVGKRNYSSDEMKGAVAEGITAQRGWAYTDDDREADLNVRLFIEHDELLVGVRLARQALHERPYKQHHRAGSLKPPVAAAMLRLIALEAGDILLDPFCGAGTIPIEAAQRGAVAIGSDVDAEAVAAARANSAAAGLPVTIEAWDARTLPLADNSVACIASNLPWGRQVVVDSALAQLYEAACAEMERVLRPEGRVALLTSLPDLVRLPKRHCKKEIEISLFGQIATILLFG